jgi:hypothetical protein
VRIVPARYGALVGTALFSCITVLVVSPRGVQGSGVQQPGDYGALIQRATEVTNIQLGKVTVADGAVSDPLDLLQQAIKVEPKRPEAYSALGFLQLYLTDAKGKRRVNDLDLIHRTMQLAIENGGEARFQVMHLHNTTVTACAGTLKIQKDRIAYEIDKIYNASKDDAFDAPLSDVKEMSFPGSFAMRASGSFALKIGDKTYNFYGLDKKALGVKLTNEEKRLIGQLTKR